ncbi:hypothetical protein [Mucilaginibacter antarcticus]|uniref:Uncharacterized protein n=1 Tax=Mucilaginibacter antarcticus TaxID=1855725 RepID=A0ABW5XMQ5_9SPHI
MKKGLQITLFFLLINITNLFAQGPAPCNDGDPDLNCPIDTWVVAFAAIVLIITLLHLQNKKTVAQ